MKTTTTILAIFCITALLLTAGCNPKNDEVFVEKMVLQGQMFIGHAPQVRITHTIPIEYYFDSSQVGVSGAVATLTAGSTVFQLSEVVADPRGSGYYGLTAPDTHTVTPGMVYAIHVEANGHVLDAETRAAGYTHITYQNLDMVMTGTEALVMRWALDSLARGYWLIFDNLNPHRADDSTLLNNESGQDNEVGVYTQYWNVPPVADSVRAPWFLFNRCGLHRVRLYTCDYAMWFYSSSYSPRQTDVVPMTNVHGGLGLFSAGDVDTTYFYMQKNPNLD